MKNLTLLLLLVLFIVSCKNCDDEEPTPDVVLSESDFLPLQQGNYWIYETTARDTNDVSIIGSGEWIDSIYIAGDTIVGDSVFTSIYRQRLNSTQSPKLIAAIRNVNGQLEYLYNHELWFAPFSLVNNDTISTDTIEQIPLFWEEIMNTEIMTTISTPAGDFMGDIIDIQSIARQPDASEEWRKRRVGHSYYKKDIGLIARSYFYFNSGNRHEVKLARYQLNN